MRGAESEREVLYVWPYLEWGGAQIYFIGIMKRARDRFAVRAIMPQGSAERLLSYMKQANVPCEFFDAHVDAGPAPTLWRKIQRHWRKAHTEFVIVRHLGWRRLKRAVLHVDFGPWSSFWLLLYLALRCHVLVTLHTALPQLSPVRRAAWKLKFTFLTSMPKFHLLASNREMIESLRPYLPDQVRRDIRLAYSGIDRKEIDEALSEEIDRASLREKYGLPPQDFLVFGMGQFIERKGCWVLLDAARELCRGDSRIGFVWIGTGPVDEETQRRIEEYNLGDSFHLIPAGEIGNSRLELLKLLRVANLFVLPSLTEGLPLALLEAMALGLPCVASNINAIPEALSDNNEGILIAPRDVTAWAVAISRLEADGATRERIARAGQKHVRENFDERETSQVTVALYDACFETV